jgi:hypothetical protein
VLFAVHFDVFDDFSWLDSHAQFWDNFVAFFFALVGWGFKWLGGGFFLDAFSGGGWGSLWDGFGGLDRVVDALGFSWGGFWYFFGGDWLFALFGGFWGGGWFGWDYVVFALFVTVWCTKVHSKVWESEREIGIDFLAWFFND